MAGLNATMMDVNNKAGQAVVVLAQALDQCVAINAMLNDSTRIGGQSGLVTMGFSAADATLILNSFGDLTNLAAVAHGQQAQPGASDFFFHAKLLMGVTPL